MPCTPPAPPEPVPLAWRVIVPVKEQAVAKSRLTAPAGVSKSALAHAMARDTVQAATAAVAQGAVAVVTCDVAMTAWATHQGIATIADPGQGLNAAVNAAQSVLSTGPMAVLLGDLPALRPEQLRSALIECSRHPLAFVPDHSGTGTVLLASTRPGLVPCFGENSAWRHEQATGAVRLALPVDGLRQDVDDATDLAAAVALGVGAHTRRVLAGPTTQRADRRQPI
ncbi:MAG: 2-phospho-L-lactate guanylyltransferase [Ornithinimicrobium sp.]